VTVLGGSRHDYPAQTTMTVTHTACGADVRWDALDQRRDLWTTCQPDARIELRDFTTYHSFYGQPENRQYRCQPETLFRPAAEAAGTRFSGRCTSDGAAAEIGGEVVGIEDVQVGDQVVAAIRVRLDEMLTGATAGSRTSDSWYALHDGLLLKRTAHTEADTAIKVGTTHYTEVVELRLLSLTPRR
jgi:hypothetical protein